MGQVLLLWSLGLSRIGEALRLAALQALVLAEALPLSGREPGTLSEALRLARQAACRGGCGAVEISAWHARLHRARQQASTIGHGNVDEEPVFVMIFLVEDSNGLIFVRAGNAQDRTAAKCRAIEAKGRTRAGISVGGGLRFGLSRAVAARIV